MPMMEKFFDSVETTPNWVVGRVYILKSIYLKNKAIKFYFNLIKRHPLYEF